MTHKNERLRVVRVVDNEATEVETVAVLEHITSCPECKSLMEDLLAIRAVIVTADRADVPQAIDDIMMEIATAAARPKISRWQEWLDDFRVFKPVMAYAAMALALGAFIGGLGFRLGEHRSAQQSKTYLTDQDVRLFDAEYPGSITEVYQEIEKGGL
ncbi:MAG: hypothetical protein V1913_02345 [Fibrobacterota bacterium]